MGYRQSQTTHQFQFLADTSTKSATWRLNSSLVTDPILLPKLNTALNDFFKHNVTPGMDKLTVWEAHKCSIRRGPDQNGCSKKERSRKGNPTAIAKISPPRNTTQAVFDGPLSDNAPPD